MPASKEAEKLTLVHSSLALTEAVHRLKLKDWDLAHLHHPFNARAWYDADEGIDLSIILDDTKKGETLIKLVQLSFENDPAETREHFIIPEDYVELAKLRFGMADGYPKIYSAISEEKEIPLSAARNHVETVVRRLRKPPRSGHLKKFLEENYIYKPVLLGRQAF